ncbi:MAG: AAA-associated domain-containing protein [Alphaproteobacteria bacterium]|nr:AAA-associated domain-containing protein [Alphaproteobacteria bacterium]
MIKDLLTINGISKWYGEAEKPTLSEINLTVKENEFVSILGKSGCGKSTFLRILAGLMAPNEGEVLYQGLPFTPTHPRIAMVFQSHALLPWLNVLENVELGLEALGLSHSEMEKRALNAIDLIGLDGYESAYPKELSEGMRQRVGFARALVVNPDILLLDEPFSALDILTAENIRNDLMEIWIEKRISTKAIIMISHSVIEAVALANRLIIFNHDPGRIMKEIDVSLRYPRDETSLHFKNLVDTVYTTLLTTKELTTGAKAKVVIDIGYRLPQISIHKLQGLMNALIEAPYYGKADIFALAESENLSANDSLPLFEALELLGFAKMATGDIELTPSGKALCDADILERKKVFAYHLMRHIPLASYIYHTLQDLPKQSSSRQKFLEELKAYMSAEEAIKTLFVVINWGRYAELFAYDTEQDILSLENSEVEE